VKPKVSTSPVWVWTKETYADKRGYPRTGADGKQGGGARGAPLQKKPSSASIRGYLRPSAYRPFPAA
jgi:hypothetical protein